MNELKMDFMKNQAVIEQVVKWSVSEGRINNFMLTMCKEVFLVGTYLPEYKYILDEDETVVLLANFNKIRDEKLLGKLEELIFVEDLDEFDELLELELIEEVKAQIRELDKENSMEKVVEDFLFGLLSKIPSEKNMMKMIKDLPKLVNTIDNEKVKNVMEVVKSLGKK